MRKVKLIKNMSSDPMDAQTLAMIEGEDDDFYETVDELLRVANMAVVNSDDCPEYFKTPGTVLIRYPPESRCNYKHYSTSTKSI